MRKIIYYFIIYLFSFLLMGCQGCSIKNKLKEIDQMLGKENVEDFRHEGEESHTVLLWVIGVYSVILWGILIIQSITHIQTKEQANKLEQDALSRQNEFDILSKELKKKNKLLEATEKEIKEGETLRIEQQAHGQDLFTSIEQGGNTLSWRKNDFICFINYYKLRNPSFVHQLEKQYNKLTPLQMTFCIFDKGLNKSDKELMDIFAFSSSSLRSIKSRIKSRLHISQT